MHDHQMPFPTLETKRLILRFPCADDFEKLREFYASPRSSMVGGPLNDELTWRVLAAEIGHWHMRGFGRFAVVEKESNMFCGLIGPWFPLGWPEPEVGWDLMNGYEGKGYAYEAAFATLRYAFTTLNWSTAISFIADENASSEKLARALGALPDGRYTLPRFGDHQIFRHDKSKFISTHEGG